MAQHDFQKHCMIWELVKLTHYPLNLVNSWTKAEKDNHHWTPTTLGLLTPMPSFICELNFKILNWTTLTLISYRQLPKLLVTDYQPTLYVEKWDPSPQRWNKRNCSAKEELTIFNLPSKSMSENLQKKKKTITSESIKVSTWSISYCNFGCNIIDKFSIINFF